MKKYTHAWLAFKAIERLENVDLSAANKRYAAGLIKWFKDHRDGVIQGAWYPDMVIKDMASSHILKMEPSDTETNRFKYLPSTYLIYQSGKKSQLRKRSFSVDKDNNLPDRCESIAHSVIDNLKMQETELKGSPISPTDNHVATLLFMLSHYVADAHMPFHCDSRRFSEGDDLHGFIEKLWDDEIKDFYDIDKENSRFFYDPAGYPLLKTDPDSDFSNSFLKDVENTLNNRAFSITWGRNNRNVWDFMSAICQYSYLHSYALIPEGYNETNVSSDNWQSLAGPGLSFNEMSVNAFCDAIDSIARIWFRVWRKYMKWERKQRSKKK